MISTPKVLISTLSLIFFISMAYAQEVSNVQAQFNSGKAMVTYDLDETVPAYFVELLYSDDEGMTFSEPLKRVSGDINNVNSGSGKRILWDAEKELGYFSGDIVFRVKASVRTVEMPTVLDQEKFTIEVKSASSKNGKLYLNLIIEPKIDTYLSLSDYKTNLINSQGSTQYTSSLKFINSAQEDINGLSDLAVEAEAIFDNYPSESTMIPKFGVAISTGYGSSVYFIEDIPVTKID